jgi:hypothetical protein
VARDEAPQRRDVARGDGVHPRFSTRLNRRPGPDRITNITTARTEEEEMTAAECDPRTAARVEIDQLSYWTARLRDDGTVIGTGGAQRQRTRAWNLNSRIATAHQHCRHATELAREAQAAAIAADPDVPLNA